VCIGLEEAIGAADLHHAHFELTGAGIATGEKGEIVGVDLDLEIEPRIADRRRPHGEPQAGGLHRTPHGGVEHAAPVPLIGWLRGLREIAGAVL